MGRKMIGRKTFTQNELVAIYSCIFMQGIVLSKCLNNNEKLSLVVDSDSIEALKSVLGKIATVLTDENQLKLALIQSRFREDLK
jgi:hypothetical protein